MRCHTFYHNTLLLIATIGNIWMLAASPLSAEGSKIEFAVGAGDFLTDRRTYGNHSKAWVRTSYEKSIGQFDLGISVTASDNPYDLNADGSYVNFNRGDWTLGIGSVDRHWSFSPHTSMIVSTNARPIPSLYLRKDSPTRFSQPLLSWIGPWGGEIFLGSNSAESAVDSVKFFGARLELEPFTGFKIELLRTAQFTGGFRSFGSVLLGDTNEGTSREANQMAGFGASYAQHNNRFYMQAIGEDESGGLPSCWMYLAGFEHVSNFGGIPTILNLELVDTRIKYTENGFCGPNTAYNNSVHPYTNDGVVMGAPIDSEGRSINLRAQHDFGTYKFEWGIGHNIINDKNASSHRLSSQRQTGMVSHLALTRKYGKLDVTGRAAYQGFDLDRANLGTGVSISFFAEHRF